MSYSLELTLDSAVKEEPAYYFDYDLETIYFNLSYLKKVRGGYIGKAKAIHKYFLWEVLCIEGCGDFDEETVCEDCPVAKIIERCL